MELRIEIARGIVAESYVFLNHVIYQRDAGNIKKYVIVPKADSIQLGRIPVRRCRRLILHPGTGGRGATRRGRSRTAPCRPGGHPRADALAKGESVGLTGFGTFSVRSRAARIRRNPQTGESIEIAASKSAAFKAGKTLRDAVR